jgi:hypothetical protein
LDFPDAMKGILSEMLGNLRGILCRNSEEQLIVLTAMER